MPNYYSECGEDKWIDEHIKLPRVGFYIDLGCAHPTNLSNTAFLRDKGWIGIAVDANPGYAPHWESTFVAAVISNKEEIDFAFHKNSLTSRVYDGISKPNDASLMTVKTRTVQSLLNEHGVSVIDFLSVDLEGHEYEAMLTFDIHVHKPSVIIAEYNTEGIGTDYRLKTYLLSTGLYKVVHTTRDNIIYVSL